MDKLDVIFTMQKELDAYIAKSRNIEFSKEEWIQKRSIALIDEVIELNNEVNYKWWKNPKPLDADKIKEELCDVFHFFVGMCIDAGMSAEDLYKIYLDKNKENYDRQNGLSQKQGYFDEKKKI